MWMIIHLLFRGDYWNVFPWILWLVLCKFPWTDRRVQFQTGQWSEKSSKCFLWKSNKLLRRYLRQLEVLQWLNAFYFPQIAMISLVQDHSNKILPPYEIEFRIYTLLIQMVYLRGGRILYSTLIDRLNRLLFKNCPWLSQVRNWNLSWLVGSYT